MFCSEVILTLGHSKFVKEFFCAAKEKKRYFQVFIAEGAPKYVHDANQSITFYSLGKSFLRLFLQFIASLSWTRFEGHILAKELDKKGFKTTMITDSAVFAMISRVNMVISYFSNYSIQLIYIMNNISCLNLKLVIRL